MQNQSAKLTELLSREQASGFFSHYYVEAGRLDEAAPRFSAGETGLAFDLASLTKALVTGWLVHERLRALALPLEAAIGTWGHLGADFSVEIQSLSTASLLSHRSGLPAWRNLWVTHLNEGALPAPTPRPAQLPSFFSRSVTVGVPSDVYSDLGYMLLGYALETEGPLDQLFAERAQAIGVDARRLGFASRLGLCADQFVPSAFCAVRNRLLRGEVHDENCAALGGVAGHAGLFGYGPEVGTFLRKLFHASEGVSYLKANANELSQHAFEGLSGLRRGNGTSAQTFAKGRGMGHLGFVGTAFWLDLPSRRYAIFLSNRVISGRVNPHITAVRREVFGYLNELA